MNGKLDFKWDHQAPCRDHDDKRRKPTLEEYLNFICELNDGFQAPQPIKSFKSKFRLPSDP